jgi:hypothetical protein
VSTGKFADETASLSAIIALTILPIRSEVIEDAKMLNFMRNAATVPMVLLIAGTCLCAAAQPPAQPITPQMKELIAAHRTVIHGMNTPGDGGRLREFNEAPMRLLLTQGWQLSGKWAGAWLDLHPDPSAKDLDNLFVDFTPPPHDPPVYDPKLPDRYAMAGSATRIATGVYVVKEDYEESQSADAVSTFFVVARDLNGHFLSKWSIKPLAEHHYRKRDEIGRWAFLNSCAYYCGPLVAQEILPLPPSGDLPRFAIDAFQATNGNTLMKQLSVWQWNGTEAENLVIQTYMLGIEDGRGIKAVDDILIVPTKEPTHSFSSYGCCEEPRGTWTIRIAPDHTQSLGHRFLQPQIQWADRLLAATGSKSSGATGLASPSVIAYLRHAEIETDAIDKCHVLSRGKKGAFEISLGGGPKLRLAYTLRNGQPYFTSARYE